MTRFFEDGNAAIWRRENALRDFSDVLFIKLQSTVFGEKAPEVLAAHLGVEVEDVNEWLKGKSLPSPFLFRRLMNMIMGGCDALSDASFEGETLLQIKEFIDKVESIQALKDVKLTHAKVK